MLKVIIADDEQNICLMIQKMIDWEVREMEVVAIANNGLDAFKYVEMYRPDIVISDIRMPGFDGLNLVKKTIEAGLDISYIIISGYKYFEYAHTALNLGVEHYLLKPIDKVELESVLDKILKNRTQKQKLENQQELEQAVKQNKKKMNRHFLTNIIHQNTIVKNMELNDVNEEYQMQFQNGFFQAFFTKVDYEKTSEWDSNGIVKIIDVIIEKELQEKKIEFINSAMNTGVVTVLNYDRESGFDIDAALQNIYQKIQFELDKFHVFSFTIGIGDSKQQFQEVAFSIQEAIYAVKCRLKAGTNKLIYYAQLKYNYVPIEQIFSDKDRRSLFHATEALDVEKVLSLLHEKLEEIRKIPFFSPVCIYDLLELMSDVLLDCLKQNATKEDILEKFQEEVDIGLDYNNRLEVLQQQMEELFVSFFEKLIQDRKLQSQLPIRLAKQYIQDNYAKQIAQEDVANAIHLSTSYLSTMFKKELGINFSDYLTSCRIDAAKQLLKETDLSMNEVAERVGYMDAKYFSKLFHKIVGIKPSVYRKLYS